MPFVGLPFCLVFLRKEMRWLAACTKLGGRALAPPQSVETPLRVELGKGYWYLPKLQGSDEWEVPRPPSVSGWGGSILLPGSLISDSNDVKFYQSRLCCHIDNHSNLANCIAMEDTGTSGASSSGTRAKVSQVSWC